MKKLIVALALVAAAGVSAQTKTAAVQPATVQATGSVETKAQKNIDELNAFVKLDENNKGALKQLFVKKHKLLAELEGVDAPERKEYISGIIDKKLEATLDGETYAKVKANTTLYNSLIH